MALYETDAFGLMKINTAFRQRSGGVLYFLVVSVLMVAVTAMEGNGFSVEAWGPTMGLLELTVVGGLTAAVATIVANWHFTLICMEGN